MSRLILSTFILVSNSILLLFTLRRCLFLLTAWRLETGDWRLKSSPPLSGTSASLLLRPSVPPPPCLLLVPFRNEAANLRQLLPLLARLDYPIACLTVVLVNDGSWDDSGRFCQQFISQHPNWHLLTLPHNIGKAAALNEALRHFPDSEFVAVFDADERPSPHTLHPLLAAFTKPDVGAVNGRRAVSNPLATPLASYATLETIVHQLITNRAKDALQLAPALIGSNCIYRRAALTAVGGFTPGSLLEDSDLTVKLARAGWRTRFIPTAVSYHAVPTTMRGYWQQRLRWTAGFQSVAQEQITAVIKQNQLSRLLRLELGLFSLGYLDRMALLGAICGRWWRQRPSPLTTLNIGLHLFTPLLQILLALKIAHAPPLLWQRLINLPLFYILDMAATLAGIVQKAFGKPASWET